MGMRHLRHPERHKKALLTHGSRFIGHARTNNRRSYALIETQNYTAAHAEMTRKMLPQVLAMDWDHLSIYYHPLVDEPAGGIMDWMGPAMASWRRAETSDDGACISSQITQDEIMKSGSRARHDL